MILGLYAIRDLKSGFLAPTAEQNDEVAKRNFALAIRSADSKSLFFTNPGDYAFFKLGTYDTNNGHVHPDQELLAEATDFWKGDV